MTRTILAGDKTAGAAGAGAATAGQELIYVGAGAGGIALVGELYK